MHQIIPRWAAGAFFAHCAHCAFATLRPATLTIALLMLVHAPHGSDARADEAAPPSRLSVTAARTLVAANKIDLIDIRRPSEWRRSGIAAGATPLTMHTNFDRFLARLRKRQAQNGGRPIALICHGGLRSRRMQNRLARAGLRVSDVTAGMFGNRRGDTGWVRAGLPVVPVK
ncbi:MAG: rhodanese-like domain-containing protein [Pseudomonadota bacterium]